MATFDFHESKMHFDVHFFGFGGHIGLRLVSTWPPGAPGAAPGEGGRGGEGGGGGGRGGQGGGKRVGGGGTGGVKRRGG